MERTDPPLLGTESEMLRGYLRYHRETLAWKCDGLTPEQLCHRPVPTSRLSLIGLVRHLAEVERSWFVRGVAGVPESDAPPIFYDRETNVDGDFDDTDPATVVADLATWRSEIARADEIIAAADLDGVLHHSGWGEDLQVRWVLVHMIEEYARHNGHADLLREAIDGQTGE